MQGDRVVGVHGKGEAFGGGLQVLAACMGEEGGLGGEDAAVEGKE